MLSTKVSQEVARAFEERAASQGTTRNGLLKQMVHDLVRTERTTKTETPKTEPAQTVKTRHLHRPGRKVATRFSGGVQQVRYACKDCPERLPWRNA